LFFLFSYFTAGLCCLSRIVNCTYCMLPLSCVTSKKYLLTLQRYARSLLLSFLIFNKMLILISSTVFYQPFWFFHYWRFTR
jgi:hypothetical protein